jgi:hypothetical protein
MTTVPVLVLVRVVGFSTRIYPGSPAAVSRMSVTSTNHANMRASLSIDIAGYAGSKVLNRPPPVS